MIRNTFFLFAVILHLACAQSTLHPYKTNWNTDGITLGTAVIVAFSASAIDDKVPKLTTTEIDGLNKQEINAIDRFSAGLYSTSQSSISDILVGSAILSPVLFVFDNDVRGDIGTVATMYIETALFATFLPSYGKGSVQRIRPYVYGSKAPLSEKLSSDSRRSFFSGHATWAFATSVFFAQVYSDFHPTSKYTTTVWTGAIGIASTVSILRVTSGAHFLTDIAVGAAVGSAVGYLIPYFHRTTENEISLSPFITPRSSGFSLAIRLK
ncbi:MAG: phosphatase PAP2 family protein [Bacteroidota bacterium]